MGLDNFKSEDNKVSSGFVDLEHSEVERRIPHVANIESGKIRQATIELASNTPEYFWEVPASSSGYHHPACRGDKGLWVHTLMVATVVERLGESYMEQNRIYGDQMDYARSACILHDMRKNGNPANPSTSSTSDHDLRMASVIDDKDDLSSQIASAVQSHMGPWYDGPEPKTDLQCLVHNADMIASTHTVTPKIHTGGDVPEELQHVGKALL